MICWKSNLLNKTFDFYFFSLSRHRDDPGQWKEYGLVRALASPSASPLLCVPAGPNRIVAASN